MFMCNFCHIIHVATIEDKGCRCKWTRRSSVPVQRRRGGGESLGGRCDRSEDSASSRWPGSKVHSAYHLFYCGAPYNPTGFPFRTCLKIQADRLDLSPEEAAGNIMITFAKETGMGHPWNARERDRRKPQRHCPAAQP